MNKFLVLSLSAVCTVSVMTGCAPQSRPTNAGKVVKGGGETNPAGKSGANSSAGSSGTDIRGVEGQAGGNNPATTVGLSDLGVGIKKIGSPVIDGIMHMSLTLDAKGTIAKLAIDPKGSVTAENAEASKYFDLTNARYTCNVIDSSPTQIMTPVTLCPDALLRVAMKNPEKPDKAPVLVGIHHRHSDVPIENVVMILTGKTDQTNLFTKGETVKKVVQIENKITDFSNPSAHGFSLVEFIIAREEAPAGQKTPRSSIEGSRNLSLAPTTVLVKVVGSLGNDENGKPLSVQASNIALENISFDSNQVNVEIPVLDGSKLPRHLIFKITPVMTVKGLTQAEGGAVAPQGSQATSAATSTNAGSSSAGDSGPGNVSAPAPAVETPAAPVTPKAQEVAKPEVQAEEPDDETAHSFAAAEAGRSQNVNPKILSGVKLSTEALPSKISTPAQTSTNRSASPLGAVRLVNPTNENGAKK